MIYIEPSRLQRFRRLFPTQDVFLFKCTPATALSFSMNPKAVWRNDYPTLRQVISMFPTPTTITSRGAALKFLAIHLAEYLNTCPQRESFTREQLNQMVLLLFASMADSNVAEIMVFFAFLRTGKWKVYNKGNIHEILEVYHHEFKDYRNYMIDNVHSEQYFTELEQRYQRATPYPYE